MRTPRRRLVHLFCLCHSLQQLKAGLVLQPVPQLRLHPEQFLLLEAKDIVAEEAVQLVDPLLRQPALTGLFRVDHQMHVGMMGLVMVGSVPLELIRRDVVGLRAP